MVVRVVDVGEGLTTWTGDLDALVADNGGDGEIVDAADLLRATGQPVHMGGGAAPLYRIERTDD